MLLTRSIALIVVTGSSMLGEACGAADRAPALPMSAEDLPRPLVRHFKVFRRDRRKTDVIPGQRTTGSAAIGRSRLVARSGSLRAWVVPDRDGLCVATRLSGGGGGLGCGIRITPGVLNGTEPPKITQVGPGRPGHRLVVFLLLADGARDVELKWSDGRSRRVAMGPNGVITRTEGASSIVWRVRSGTEHHTSI